MLPVFTSAVEEQYYKSELFEIIVQKLQEQGIDLSNVSRKDIAGVDEFHVRGAEVSKELVRGLNLTDARVLDVGCGIGGPARMLIDECNCTVTGVDLSHEFIRTAKQLSELLGMSDRLQFLQADALDLPFEDRSFDVVWTQHVQMNIKDKTRFYSEINRVLSEDGLFIYYDIFTRNGEDVTYPVPWANDPSVSFLATTLEMDHLLREMGFTQAKSNDQTYQATQFLMGLFNKVKENGPPKLGLNVLMGSSTMEKLGNILKGLEEKKIVLQSGIYSK